MRPRVSVVVPAFRNISHLAQTLDSILAQRYEDYELVVADHSSDDGTEQLLARYAGHDRVRVLASTPTGGGAVANWNRVSSAAQGDLLKLVCGDDLISPGAIAAQVAAFDANPSVVLVACQRDLIGADGGRLLSARGLGALQGLVPGPAAIRASVKAGTNLLGEPGGVMMKREVLEHVGWWDSSFPYLIDQATYSRVLLNGDLYAIRESQASFRLSSGQWSVRLAREQAAQARAFHRWVRDQDPGLVSKRDLATGNFNASMMAWARRAAYHWFRSRM